MIESYYAGNIRCYTVGLQEAIITRDPRRKSMRHENWRCEKCGNPEFDSDQFRATGGNFAKFFDIQNKRLTCGGKCVPARQPGGQWSVSHQPLRALSLIHI